MRANVCLHRSAAAIAAEEEGAEEQTSASSRGRGGGAIEAVAASGGPTCTVLSDQRPRFDPVPVFIGPVAGWNGPVLGPRNTSAAAEAIRRQGLRGRPAGCDRERDQRGGRAERSAGAAGRSADAAGGGQAPPQASPEAGEAWRNGQGLRESCEDCEDRPGRESRSGYAAAKAARQPVAERTAGCKTAVVRANRRRFRALSA